MTTRPITNFKIDTMSAALIANLLAKSQSQILAAWMKAQTASSSSRLDLISEPQLKAESTSFLSAFAAAVKNSGTLDIHAESFKPVLDQLADISRTRTLKGFRPYETATFILSLKRPLFEVMRAEGGKDAAAEIEAVENVSALFDQLALHTSEVFLQTREEVILRQQDDMLELSTPVVQLWDGIVALPLIGTLDSARTSVVMETLLQTIVQTGSEIAIIDITGVPTVDTVVAQHLLKTVAAARLMGADCIISGIRPQIAQTMVHLQIDLSAVTTKATMAEALRAAMKRTGFVVSRTKAAALDTVP